MKTLNKKIIDQGTMTGTTVLTSTVMDTSTIDNVSLQYVWTGTPNGTAVVQCSNDNVTWSSYTLTCPTIAGSAGNGAVQIIGWAHKYLRTVYTNSSSTGVLTVVLNGKGSL